MTAGEDVVENDNSGRRWVAGTLLIIIGVILLLGRLDPPGHWHMHGLWPLILIAIGLVRLFGADRRRPAGSGLGLVLVGAIFLLHTQGVFMLDDSWPLFIVVGGLSILIGSWGSQRQSNGGAS